MLRGGLIGLTIGGAMVSSPFLLYGGTQSAKILAPICTLPIAVSAAAPFASSVLHLPTAAQAGLVCTGVYHGKQQSETETLAAAEKAGTEAGSSAKGEGGAS